jgi:RNA polymerase sigma-70 factor (ECF subfamily)
MIPDDSILIDRALEGEEEAYAELVRRHQGMVARLCFRVTRRRDMVDDLVQEVFIHAFENLGRFKRRSGFVTWLYRIAVNQSLDALRKEKSRSRVMDEFGRDAEVLPDTLLVRLSGTGESLALGREAQARVREALAAMEPESRTLLTLRHLEELSTPEIAEALDWPEGTVRSRLYYARIQLADILRPFIDESSRLRKEKEKA